MESFCYKSNHIYVIKVIVILCCLAFVPILYPVQDGMFQIFSSVPLFLFLLILTISSRLKHLGLPINSIIYPTSLCAIFYN